MILPDLCWGTIAIRIAQLLRIFLELIAAELVFEIRNQVETLSLSSKDNFNGGSDIFNS